MKTQYRTIQEELQNWNFAINHANNVKQTIARYLTDERIPDEFSPRAYAYPVQKMRIICQYYAIRFGYPIAEPPSKPQTYYVESTTSPSIGFNVLGKDATLQGFFPSHREAYRYASFLNLNSVTPQ